MQKGEPNPLPALVPELEKIIVELKRTDPNRFNAALINARFDVQSQLRCPRVVLSLCRWCYFLHGSAERFYDGFGSKMKDFLPPRRLVCFVVDDGMTGMSL